MGRASVLAWNRRGQIVSGEVPRRRAGLDVASEGSCVGGVVEGVVSFDGCFELVISEK